MRAESACACTRKSRCCDAGGGIAAATVDRMRIIMPAVLAIGCVAPTESLVVEKVKVGVPRLGNLGTMGLLPDNYPEDGGAYQYTISMGLETAAPSLWKVPLPAGDAVCVDYSTPVVYVRAAPANSPYRNNWIFFIQGGGGMQTTDDVLTKWYGGVHGEMSSRWAPDAIGPTGIFSTAAANPFRNFNMVFIHKCSSDRYTGRKSTLATLRTSHQIMGTVPGTMFGTWETLPVGYELEYAFRGHDIVDSALDMLATSTVEYDTGAGEVTMPSLADARTVFFIGHSGGSRGATMIVDEVAERIRGFSAPNSPTPDVRLVMDAGFDPGAESVVNGSMYPATSYPTNDPANSGNPLATVATANNASTTLWRADGDATCMANEANVAVCSDVAHVLMNWVETPMFIRQDLADSKHNLGTDQNGDSHPDCWQVPWEPDWDCYGDTVDQANAVLAQIEDLDLMRTTALTATELGTSLRASSGFFPACGEHEGAHTDAGYLDTLTGANGIQRSYRSALWTWYLFPNVPLRAVEVANVTDVVDACGAVSLP